MCGLWIIVGLFARDPWKPQETDFVVTIAAHNGHLQNLPDIAKPSTPPSLYLDMAAASARIFSPYLPQHEGARIVNAILFALALMLLWSVCGRYGGNHSARRGWIGVFLAFGMTGLLVRAHLLNLATPAFFGSALLIFAAARLRRHALVGGIMTAAAIGFLFTAASPSIAVFAMLAFLITLCHPAWRKPSLFAGLAVAIAFVLPIAILSPMLEFAADFFVPHFSLIELAKLNLASYQAALTALLDLLRTALWALFPALPIAAAALWFRRKIILSEPLMIFCISLIAIASIHFWLFGGDEESLFWLMPPLAVLAARGIEKLPDNMAVILDWFALIIVGVCGVGGMWALWLLLNADASSWLSSGEFATWLGEQSQKFPQLESPQIPFWRTAAAACITLLWTGLAANIGRSNERAALNWSSGIAVMWCVFNLLWVPFVDSGKSYRPMAQSALAVTADSCVSTSPAAVTAAAQLYYFGVKSGDKSCPLHLQKTFEMPIENGERIWQGGRYGTIDYTIYRR